MTQKQNSSVELQHSLVDQVHVELSSSQFLWYLCRQRLSYRDSGRGGGGGGGGGKNKEKEKEKAKTSKEKK